MKKTMFAKVLDNAASLPLGIKVSIKAVTIQNVHYAATHYTPPTAEQPFGVFTLNEGKRDLIKSWTTPVQLTQTTDGDDETEGQNDQAGKICAVQRRGGRKQPGDPFSH